MVRAESSPREELKQAIIQGTELSIGLIKYVSKVKRGETFCYRCDFAKVKEMVDLLVRNRVCSCCLEADRYLSYPRSHVLKKVGEIKADEEDEREDPESNENDV